MCSIISGLFGGVTSVIANCFSYVAALTERDERTLRVSVVEGMQLVAAMAGPFLSKLMKYHLGTLAVFIGSNQHLGEILSFRGGVGQIQFLDLERIYEAARDIMTVQ